MSHNKTVEPSEGMAEKVPYEDVIENSEFFETVRVHTIVGFFANPEYGGNRDQIGWKNNSNHRTERRRGGEAILFPNPAASLTRLTRRRVGRREMEPHLGTSLMGQNTRLLLH
jgi:hypothetical protein